VSWFRFRCISLVVSMLLFACSGFTQVTESWNCSNSPSLNCDLSWTEAAGDFSIDTNQALRKSGSVLSRAICVSSGCSAATLGSSYYVEVRLALFAADTNAGVVFRQSGDSTEIWRGVIDAVADVIKIENSDEVGCSASVTINTSTYYTVRVTVAPEGAGKRFTITLNGSGGCSYVKTSDSLLAVPGIFGKCSADPCLTDGARFDDFATSAVVLGHPHYYHRRRSK
jgi:hypothetical protein